MPNRQICIRALNRLFLLATACCSAALSLCGCKPSGSRQPVELNIWSAPSGYEEQNFQRLCRRFEREHPGVKIRNVGALKQDTLTRAIVAGVPPDLAYLYNMPALGPLAANGAIMTLDDRFKKAGFQESQFLPGCISQAHYQGHLYAMPTTRDSLAFYRSRARFRECGLDPDRPPRTLEEIIDMAVKLTSKNPDGTLAKLGMELPVDDPAVLFAMFGGDVWDARTGRLTANCPENVEALRWMLRLSDAQGGYRAISALASGLGGDNTSLNPLATGKLAMRITGEWAAMHLEKFAPGTDYALSEIPYPANRPDLRNLAWEDGDFMCIPNGSKHPDLAWEFMRWLQAPAQQADYAEAMSNLPNIMALRDSPRFSQGSRDKRALGFVLKHIASDPRNAHFLPALPVMQLYTQELHTAIDHVLYHDLTPQAALNAVQERIEREQRQYGSL
jgi:multiple sugar transport system substrate-binding protein